MVRFAKLSGFLLLATLALAQDPYLDLPVYPGQENLLPNPIPPDPEDDPRDEPAPVIFGEEIESENDTLCYVLDVSGSMGVQFSGSVGPGQEDFDTDQSGTLCRMEMLKLETVRSITGLSSNVKFNIVTFNCTLTKLWSALMPANDANKAVAIGFVLGLGYNSGTATAPGVCLALNDREVQAVILVTDGAPNCPYQGSAEYVCQEHRKDINNFNTQRATISVFGIDAEWYWRAFCQNVASDSGGSYFDISGN